MYYDVFQLTAITPEQLFVDEAALINAAFNMHAFDRIHLRHPEASAEQIESIIKAVDEPYRPYLSLHTHHDLARKYGCGIHLRSSDSKSGNQIKADRDAKLCVSCSAHCYEELRSDVNYNFLSPIFDSISKTGYSSAFDLRDNRLADALLRYEVVALGGVDWLKLGALRDAGFFGAAMLGAVDWTISGIRYAARQRMRGMLQIITHDPTPEGTFSQCAPAVSGGCKWVQVRMKDNCVEDIRKVLSALVAPCKKYGVTLIVDDHVELAAMSGVSGVHLGQNDMPVSEARKILGDGKIIGLTVNTLDQAKKLVESDCMPDYIGVGPWKHTKTKAKHAPVLGADGIRHIITTIRAKIPAMPFVAIGGVTANHIDDIMRTGADGVAVSSAIVSAADPVTMAEKFLKKLDYHTIYNAKR